MPDIVRKSLSVPLQLKADPKGLKLKGYASIFNVLDHHGDIVMPGAFAKSIREKAGTSKIKLLWQHKEPMGLPTQLIEDHKGLYFEADVSDTAENVDRLKYIADRVVDTTSIGFWITKATEFEDEELRAQLRGIARHFPMQKLEELDLEEISPVTFAANDHTSVAVVEKNRAMAVKGLHGWLPCYDDRYLLPSAKCDDETPDAEEEPVAPERPEAAPVAETETDAQQADCESEAADAPDDAPVAPEADAVDDTVVDNGDPADDATEEKSAVLFDSMVEIAREMKRDREVARAASFINELRSIAHLSQGD